MRHNEAQGDALDPRTLTPAWYAREARLAHMLPYVSLVDDRTVRTRANELFQCIRLDGLNSYTTDDAHLDKVAALFARIVAQLGPEFSYYVHKVSKAIAPDLEPVREDSFAGEVDRLWRQKLDTSGLRDKTLTLTIIHRPPPKSFLPFMGRSAPDRFREETQKGSVALTARPPQVPWVSNDGGSYGTAQESVQAASFSAGDHPSGGALVL
ncbi:MAG: hypothetical protein RLQ73_16715, partial [Hoeflea sp. D1-CHI-28]